MVSKIKNIFLFFYEVKLELLKVVWPSRNEAIISTIMVVLFSIMAMIFFFFVDHLVAYGIEFLLSL